MAVDMFLKIDGIPGESTDSKHKDWIEVLSYSFGASQPSAGAASSGGARTSQRVNVQDLTCVHTLDKASPKLFLFCCNGTHIKDVTLTLNRATGDKQKYMEYKMTDVTVSSIRPGGASEGSGLPLEELSFNFGKIELIYTETDHQTGKAKGDVKSHWSLVENKGG
ncbi:MAG: type VI secretion system tube protein Hcp, partial [Planctomycetota bacterium]|nr:type VI secretion system tube protein Hcp [Planctomycetota bacterium]